MTAAQRRVGLYLAVVQFFFALTWTVYVIFLPQVAAQAGIAKEAVIWILMLDQLIFVFSDYAMGVAAADRNFKRHFPSSTALYAPRGASSIA